MVILISGEDILSSRVKLNSVIENDTEITRIDGKKQKLSEALDLLAGQSLFQTKRTVVFENFTKISPLPKLLEEILVYEKDKETKVVLWEGNTLDKRKIGKLKSVEHFEFLFPKVYYSFLDSFSSVSKVSLKLLSDVLKTFEPEQVLYGLIRRVRQLMVARTGEYQEFSELRSMQDWQLSKLRKQAKMWSESDLKKYFIELVELDEKLKTGSLPLPLTKHLDILLMQDLN